VSGFCCGVVTQPLIAANARIRKQRFTRSNENKLTRGERERVWLLVEGLRSSES
jgi:hypothetical protein